MFDQALATLRVYTDHGTHHPVAIRLRATTPRTLAFRASIDTSAARDALNLAREIHDAQRREADDLAEWPGAWEG